MTASLTTAQETALRTIAENPGQVVAALRGETGFLTINGNTENKLRTLGLIRKVHHHTGSRVVAGERFEYEVSTWELTDEGREALGLEIAAPVETAETVTETPAAPESNCPELDMEGSPNDLEWLRIGMRNRMIIGHTPDWDVKEFLARFEAAVRADQQEKDAALVESGAWPHERPEHENQALYRLAEKIRSGGTA